MVELKLALLGSPNVTVDGKSINVESRKALALLFYLAVTDHRYARDGLATLFWPEQDQSRARASLRQALWLLRGAGLELWLIVDQDAVELRGEYWCDVHHFQAAIRANRVDEALALYRDDLLAGFSLRNCPEFDQWQFLQADELRRQLAGVLERHVVQYREEGETEKGLQYARRWLALDPLHEAAHRHLMTLYAYAGQHAAALRQYEECRRLLEEELGVTPEDETVELYQAIKSRQVSAPVKARSETNAAVVTSPTLAELPVGDPASTAIHVTSPPSPAHNLPIHLTPFVGREEEVGELAKLVAKPECRLVSIIGPGGIGKTRLAEEVARRFIDDPTDEAKSTPASSKLFQGVLFVPLHTVDSTNGIIAAIAEAGSIVFYHSEPMRQQLLDYLRARKLLLLLDNFEHLLSSADFIVELLTRAPGITILVTSREALNLQGEWLWSVGGLDFPEDVDDEDSLLNYSAVRLFVQSARRIQPHFSFAAEYPHVVQICRLLGGMPLAIELAVAWLRVIPCAQIAHEITHNLDFLTTRMRDVPERHRSIQAVFEHSWRLLTPSEQETFQRLSVFRGGFDLQAAAHVAEASWRDLAALKEKSLLNVGSGGRYTIHELLRQYGAGKLEENSVKKEATLVRFATYFADFLHQRETILFGPGQLQAAADIVIELDNIRAAWQWILQRARLEEIRRSVSSLYFFSQLQSRFLEGSKALEDAQLCLAALEPSHERDLTLAHIHCHQGWLYLRLGEFEKANSILQRSRELYAQLGEAPHLLPSGDPTTPLAIVYHVQGDFHRALELAEEVLHPAVARKDTHHLAYTHYALATTNLALGHYHEARTHIEAASEAARATGNLWFLPYILNESGKMARAIGHYAEAKALFQESYDIKRIYNDPEGMAVALNHLGEIAYLQCDYETAQQFYVNAFEIYSEINDQGGLAASARGLGQISLVNEDLRAAKLWFERSLQIAMKMRFWPLVYSLLIDVGQLLMQANSPMLAVKALILAQEQPASDHETKKRASQLLNHWQSEMDAKAINSNLAASQVGDEEILLQQILGELSEP